MIRFRVLLAAVVACFLGIHPGWAVEIKSGPTAEATLTNAVIRWSTDGAAGGRVHFGTAVKQMDGRAAAEAISSEHEVRIKGLRPDTTYWYTVGTARLPLATNSFRTAGSGEPSRPGHGAVKPEVAATPKAAGTTATPAAAAAGKGGFDATQYKVPPARQTWGAPRTLQDHFDRHGADFGAKNPDDYAAQAWLFLRRAKVEGLPAKRDDDGVLRVYEAKTRTFASYNRDLTAKTFFKPGRRDYFDDQPGKPVDLNKLVP